MPGSFRRAQLRGSDEIFRPTRPATDVAAAPSRPPVGGDDDGDDDAQGSAPHSDAALGVVRPEGRLVRLTDEEVEMLIESIQKMKYPTATKLPTKPPMDVYERLEELRQKLMAAR